MLCLSFTMTMQTKEVIPNIQRMRVMLFLFTVLDFNNEIIIFFYKNIKFKDFCSIPSIFQLSPLGTLNFLNFGFGNDFLKFSDNITPQNAQQMKNINMFCS